VGSRFVARLPSSAAWYDLWHTHVDWRSEANNDPTARRETLQSLFAAWEQVQQIGNGLSTPWQSWLVLDTEDSGQDAVYLHTPNPNRGNFP
jgi:hypothetical protein